jgi:hypothetical protein
MKKQSDLVSQILRVVAFGMPVCVLVLMIMHVADVNTSVVMLSIGMLAGAFDALKKG